MSFEAPPFRATGGDRSNGRRTGTGDSVRLIQVFANLLTNAAKYTKPGGRISVTLRRHEDRAEISVRDNGVGINPAQLSSIFEMFTQVDRSNRLSQGGLGIGLTLVRNLVAMHGGRVEARSNGFGSGSEFVVELPLAQSAPTGSHSAKPPEPLPGRRILIVDDNRDAAEMLGVLLEALGAIVSMAHGGREALDALDVFKPDAVLLDIGMPGMDGYEVARRIRAMPLHADLLLITVTGWAQERDRRL
jgi:CheY-like chemotaxis protein